MRISTMACHALHLLLCLSEQDRAIPASASELAVSTGISEKFVQKIMRLLQTEGIIKSVRGIAGGHMLARNPEAITLADIICAVEGGITLPGVNSEAPAGKAALDVWDKAAEALRNSLDAVTLCSVRQNAGLSQRHGTRRKAEYPVHRRSESELGGPNAKAYSLGRQRCRKSKQDVATSTSI